MGINGLFLSYPERYKTGPIGKNKAEMESALRENDVHKHSASQLADGVEISSDAREMLRIMVSKFEADTDDTIARDLTIQNILPASRQTRHLRIRTVPGISIEIILGMREIRKTVFRFLIRSIGIWRYLSWSRPEKSF